MHIVVESVGADQVDDVTGSSVAAELEPELGEPSASVDLLSTGSGSKVLATPAVRRIASENKVCLLYVGLYVTTNQPTASLNISYNLDMNTDICS